MSYKSFITHTISDSVGICRGLLQERKGHRILMYHSIGGHTHNDHMGIFSVSKELFSTHINILSSHPTIKTEHLAPFPIDDNRLKVSITFDDGYLDNLRVAAPILIEQDIPFTVFVTSNFVRNNMPGFLGPADLRELAGLPGVEIGAHGVTHTALTQCDNLKLHSELHDGKKYLEDIIGQPITSIAYPHGEANSIVEDEVAATGYKLAVCSQFDINRSGSNPLMLSRTTILQDDTERVFRQKLSGDWDWYRFRNMSHWYANIMYKMK